MNKKGTIVLAIFFSMVLLIGATAVFGLVSGRFSITGHINKRVQQMRDTESASYVAYQLIRDGAWAIPDEGEVSEKAVVFKKADGTQDRVTVDIAISGTAINGSVPINARVKK